MSFAVALAAGAARADVKLPAVFGQGMVLQREMPVPVWGWAAPGEEVTVSFRDQSVSTRADDHGNWKLKLAPLQLGEPGTLTVQGKNTLTFGDVLVGEVWVCSGQSNMGMTVNASLDADLEKAAAHHPQIRLFQVPLLTAVEPQSDVNAQWRVCAPETVGSFTAVGYFFGRQLQETVQMPVGLIQTAWGGTRAEAWTSPEAMASNSTLKPILDAWVELTAKPENQAAAREYEEAILKWEGAVKQALEQGRNPPGRPQAHEASRWSRHHPSNLYNAMVAPLIPYAIRGAIWYQGESNANRAYQYRTLMPALVQSWRQAWGQGDFYFYQVQLANFREITPQPGESTWAELREAQDMARTAIPNMDAACITDIGAAKDIHPKDKQNVGKRLARLALFDIYGRKDIVRQGPTYLGATFEGAKAVVKFDTHGGGKLESYYKEPLTGFALAGEDRKWVWGEARITGDDTVEITAPGIDHPVAVRYNWSDNPQGNLYSAAYLPAYPFRSDDWEGTTANAVRP